MQMKLASYQAKMFQTKFGKFFLANISHPTYLVLAIGSASSIMHVKQEKTS